MTDEECGEEGYLQLKDLRIRFDRDGGDDSFSLCFWIYLSSSARPSSVILRQMPSDGEDGVPFLVLSDKNKLTIFPFMFLHKEAPSPGSSFSWTDIPRISAEVECSLEKWVHVGCEVATDYMHLYVDGTPVGEKPLSLSSVDYHDQDNMKKITLAGNEGKLQGYVHYVRVLPISSAIMDQFVKNPPVQLSLDGSCISDGVEEGDDGVWSIVGGKASCRRNFSLEVVLLDALGQSVHMEMEIIASLVYSDNRTPVEKTNDDAEAPLLIICDGLEFPSTDRPIKLLHGRVTIKLKISQLSSKSDNRLFRVCFHSSNTQRYPFLKAYSHPIRCISRSRSSRTSGLWKKFSTTHLLDGTHSPGANEGLQEIQDNYGDGHFETLNRNESKCTPSVKRFKVGYDKSQTTMDANGISEQLDDADDNEKAFKASLEVKRRRLEGTDDAPSDSESTGARTSRSKQPGETRNPISDAIIFKYCIEGSCERSILLKEMVNFASNQDMRDFAEQVCLYTGCCHHRDQILIAKELIQDGADAWNSISRNKNRALWADAVPEIERKFMNIAHSATRGLSGQDMEILRRIAGCGDDMAREDFDKMWYWLYPVAFSLSKDRINAVWKSLSPKWLEGLITTDDAEYSLRGPRGLQKPGTFILRFPTSRSWPHPDAGSLVVTYVAADSTLHHKLLSLEHRELNPRRMQELLLEEPELSQLGRVTRQGT